MVEVDDYRFKYDVHTHIHIHLKSSLTKGQALMTLSLFKVKNKTQMPTVSQLLKLLFNF